MKTKSILINTKKYFFYLQELNELYTSIDYYYFNTFDY
jgi:hypothetical protein